MESNPSPEPTLARLIVSVRDLAPALHFYRDILGLGLRQQHGEFAWLFTTDGQQVMLHQRPPTPSDTSIAAGFCVNGVSDVVEGWRSEGGVVVDELEERPWGESMAVLRDPEGHLVCVSGR